MFAAKKGRSPVREILQVRFGEIFLKGSNRPYFMRMLVERIRNAVKELNGHVWLSDSRVYVSDLTDMDEGIRKVSKVFGVHSLCRSLELPKEDFNAICDELANYSIDLSDRPMIVAANKCDIMDPDSDNLERLRAHVEKAGCQLYEISAGTTQCTRNLMRVVAEKLRTLPPVTIYEPEYVEVIETPADPSALEIEHLGNTWVITGQWLERLIMNINFDDYESRNYFDMQLRKCGLFQRLEEMGIEDGDTVDIYGFAFEYQR